MKWFYLFLFEIIYYIVFFGVQISIYRGKLFPKLGLFHYNLHLVSFKFFLNKWFILKIFNVAFTKKKVRIKQIDGHTDSINSCQLINDDEIIFTISNDNTARLWDGNSGKQLHVYSNLHGGIIPQGRVDHENTKYLITWLII